MEQGHLRHLRQGVRDRGEGAAVRSGHPADAQLRRVQAGARPFDHQRHLVRCRVRKEAVHVVRGRGPAHRHPGRPHRGQAELVRAGAGWS